MDDNSTSEFKIRLDDRPAEPEHACETPKSVRESVKETAREIETRRAVKPEKSKTGLILMGILLLLLLAGYVDMRRRVITFQTSGSKESQTLAEDIQAKFSALSVNITTLEETLKKLTESQNTLNQSLARIEGALSTLKSGKADKAAMDSMEQRLSPLSDDVKNITAATNALSIKLTTEMTGLTAATAKVSNDLAAVQSKFAALQSETVAKKDLFTEIDHLENILKTNQEQGRKEIESLSVTIRRLELKIAALESKAAAAPATSTAVPSTPAPKVTEGDLRR